MKALICYDCTLVNGHFPGHCFATFDRLDEPTLTHLAEVILKTARKKRSLTAAACTGPVVFRSVVPILDDLPSGSQASTEERIASIICGDEETC